MIPLNFDSLSHGQIGSKLWLCHELEKKFAGTFLTSSLLKPSPLQVSILGSWYGFLAFLILSRNRLAISSIGLYDIDTEAHEISKKVLNYWICESFPISFHLEDANLIQFDKPTSDHHLVINTSCEHFADFSWFARIPKGHYFALQSTDMIHKEHISPIQSIEELKSKIGTIQRIFFEGTKHFSYESFSFSRFMIIGRK